MAPNWSSASWTPNPQPNPISLAAWESMASRGGLRVALPIRSRTINRAATGQLPASASRGTTVIWSAYPPMVMGQWRSVRSAARPDTSRSP